ncbi:MAG: cholesterol oxidase substrate-binding domain-containing protein [Propionibacteriaceae bacterium]|nr:cholesterol oxidase substrate-binding domain-containing protein [Propionibacteriaceae bacterium]
MGGLSRRNFLRGAAVSAGAVALAGGWVPAGRIDAAHAEQPSPPSLPSGVRPYLQRYQNWSREVVTSPLWHVTAQSEDTVVALANWAHANGWTIRPLGYSHNWSPFAVANGTRDAQILMVNMQSINRVTSNSTTVTAGAGASLDAILNHLDWRGRSIAHHPAVGSVSIAGVLQIAGHGTGVPANRERKPTGHSFGAVANIVTTLRAVVWDEETGSYVARAFDRTHPDMGALLVGLGRVFLTQVTLRHGPGQHMRCRSNIWTRGSEVLGAPGSSRRTIDRELASTGRIEITWFPFTSNPWTKTWSLASPILPPFGAIPALGPYNYVFADAIPRPLQNMITSVVNNQSRTPAFGQLMAQITSSSLLALRDLWGRSSALMRYVRANTLLMTSSGYVVLCKRSDVQWVLHEFYKAHEAQVQAYRSRRRWPMNGPIEIRVSGIDDPADSTVNGAVEALLSPTRRRPDHPEWDTAVWIGTLSLPRTPHAPEFYAEFEDTMWRLFDTDRTGIRVEWSKAWGFTSEGAYTSNEFISQRIPESFDKGQPAGARFADAVAIFDRLDPHRIYDSPLLRQMMTA